MSKLTSSEIINLTLIKVYKFCLLSVTKIRYLKKEKRVNPMKKFNNGYKESLL